MPYERVEIEGEFQSIRWAADDGSFMIGVLADRVTIVGAANPENFIQGVEYRFTGHWEEHRQFGRQFRFTTCIAKEPVTAQAVQAYLSKYLFGCGSGIGVAKGQQLIAAVGPESVLSVIKADPKRVMEVTGITPEQARLASDTLKHVEKYEHTRIQLVTLLDGRGFNQKCIDRAIEDFGVCAADRIRRDPFTLLVRKYPSAGFLRCDKLYTDLGLPEHRLKRQVICLWHLLDKANGSVWIRVDEAIIELKRLISSHVKPKRAIMLGRRAKWLSTRRDDDGVLWLAERQEASNEWTVKEMVEAIRDGYFDAESALGRGHDEAVDNGSFHGTSGERKNDHAQPLVAGAG